MFSGDRPSCPRQCRDRLHRHGFYERFRQPTGAEIIRIARYLCRQCGLTVSVLPADRLPYRAVAVERVEAFFNEQAEAGSGPDPPPEELEAGCLRRAWTRFQSRVDRLQKGFGLLVPAVIQSAKQLWQQMRLAKGTLQQMLHFLAVSDKISLLGDYRCLRLPTG